MIDNADIKGVGNLRIRIEYLEEGCILSSDVYSKSNHPIMYAKTIITSECIHILEQFLIKEVHVEEIKVNGKQFNPPVKIEEDSISGEDNTSLAAMYLEAVQTYKYLYKGWQSGKAVDSVEIRNLFLPVLFKSLNGEKDIFSLEHYSTKEDYLYHHAISTGIISGFLGKQIGLDEGDIIQAALAGCLCDVGMVKIPQTITEKKTSLTYEESQEIKKHPIYGYQLLKENILLQKGALLAILQHHERLDGSGYPRGDEGTNLHIFSRIVAAADVYHAMISERVYRKRQSRYKVFEMMFREDFGKFDLEVMKALFKKNVSIRIGSNLVLSNGLKGKVVAMNNNYPSSPILYMEDEGELLDLSKRRDIYIERVE